jgi:hypothetical protein
MIYKQQKRICPGALNGCHEIGHRTDRLLINLLDYVATLNARFRGWSKRIEIHNHQPLRVSSYSQLSRERRR